MSISDQITRLNNAKAAIKQSLENKGVIVSDSALLDEYPALVDSIEDRYDEGYSDGRDFGYNEGCADGYNTGLDEGYNNGWSEGWNQGYYEGGNGEGGGDPYYEEFYNLRTSNGTNMDGLFARTSGELDLRRLDVSNATSMNYMFDYSTATVNIDGWDTSNVTSMSSMFNYFSGSIDISKLDTSNVTYVFYMFNRANTDNIILTGLSFPRCTELNDMFPNAEGTILDLSSWDISNITNMSNMFSGAQYKKIDLTGWKTSNVTNMSYMFNSYSNNLQELIIPDWDMTNVTNSSNFFNTFSSYTQNLTLIDLSRSNDATITEIASYLPTKTSAAPGTVLVPANTSQEICDTLAAKYWTAQKPEVPEEPPVEDILLYTPGEFEYDTIITEARTMVDESHDDLSYMFNGCTNLVSVNTEDWDTSNVRNMTNMFYGCTSLTQLNLSNFDTSNLSVMSSMFDGCTSLTTLDLSNWDASCAYAPDWDMRDMFLNCTALHTLRLDNCSNDTINKIIKSIGFPTNAISGVTRTIYCKEAEAAGLKAPTNWVFSYVD